MKVAVIAPSSIPSRRANSFQVMKMCQAMAGTGQDVRLAVPAGRQKDEIQKRSWDDLAKHYGLEKAFPIEWLPASAHMRGYDYAWRAIRWAQGWQADLVYTRVPQAAALASKFHFPTILEVHDFPQGHLGPFFFKQFLNDSGARRLVIISHALAEDLSRAFILPNKESFTLVLPDGVDVGRYREIQEPVTARQAWGQTLQDHANKTGGSFLAERLTIGYSGQLYAGRGMPIIVELAARLPAINFLLVGGEPDEVSRMIEQVRARKLTNLTITGFIPNADLPCYQAMCDILLMPYQREVAASSGGDIARYLSPLKLFEYLACGRAIVASDLPVLKEILSPSTARFVPADDLEAWIRAIVALRDDPAARQQLACAARIAAQEYTWEKRAAKILANID